MFKKLLDLFRPTYTGKSVCVVNTEYIANYHMVSKSIMESTIIGAVLVMMVRLLVL